MNPPLARRKIVYDIDDVLCTCNVSTIEQVAFFARYGLIITAIKTHYVFPGVVELMKASFDEPDTDIYFSSRGIEERNKKFVRKLLKCSLGKDRASQVKYTVHTVKRKVYVGDPIECKDLNEICGDSQNATLVDDSQGMIAPGQFKNFLYVYEPRFNEFSPFCDTEGYVPLSLDCHGSMRLYYMVVHGGGLRLKKKQSSCELTFLDKKTREKKRLDLMQETHSELISKIGKAKNVGDLEETCRYEIVSVIENAGGVTKRIDRSANHFFNYVGVLFTALNENKKTGEPVSEILYRLQWRRDVEGYEGPSNQEIFWSIYDETFYEYGLSILKKYNPELAFMTPMKYREATLVPLTPKVKARYQTYLNNRA